MIISIKVSYPTLLSVVIYITTWLSHPAWCGRIHQDQFIPTLLGLVVSIKVAHTHSTQYGHVHWGQSPPPYSMWSYTLLLGHPHPAQSHHIHRYLVTPTLLSPIICIDLSPTLPTGGCSISIDPLSRYPFQSLPYPTYIHVRQAQPCLTRLIYLGPITVSSIYVRCFVSRLTICYGWMWLHHVANTLVVGSWSLYPWP